MNLKIRQEHLNDQKEVFQVVKEAFKTDETNNPQEPLLVARLRKSKAFIPELSIVAELEGKIVGHILLTKIKINDEQSAFDSLALAPVSVLPKFQRKGIGGMLIKHAHNKAIELGHKSVILLGHENYYPRFGYQLTEIFGIKLPFAVPKENCMAIELVNEGLKNVKGTVQYPVEFSE